MLERNLLLLLVSLGCVQAALEKSELDHIHENMRRMGELRARWNRKHPVPTQSTSGDSKNQVDSSHEPTIQEINEQLVSELIGGDIIPSDEDIVEMEEKLREDESENSDERPKRAASVNSAKNWPIDKPIPFSISNEFNDADKDVIRAALRTIVQNTCIDFEESNGQEKKLEFFAGEDGCFTNLGDTRTEKRNHPLSLGTGCVTIDTAQHEVMHTLGFGHTQNRADRDDYIKVIWEDIDQKYKNQFNITLPTNFNNHSVPYEYNSAMHYDSLSSSINQNRPILIPKNEDYIASVGGDHGATFNDWKQINDRYRCSAFCEKKIDCLNKGFQNSRNCTQCMCPIFYSGPRCENEVNVIDLTPGVTDKHQLNYTNPDPDGHQAYRDFSKFDKELHVIKAPVGRRIRVTLEKIEGPISCVRECTYKAVEIVDEDLSLVGKRFCCENRTGHSFVSKTNVVGYQAYSQPGKPFSSLVTFTLDPLAEGQSTVPPPTEATDASLDPSPTSESSTVASEPATEGSVEPETEDPGTESTQTEPSWIEVTTSRAPNTTDSSAPRDLINSIREMLAQLSDKFKKLSDIV